MKTYHILNGDALKEQFPKDIEGVVFVARECLVDGNVKSDSIEELFQVRAQYLSDTYDIPVHDYQSQTKKEFEKIKNIPLHSEVNLWFEDDLFCQVNFWFVSYLLNQYAKDCKVFLVRPESHTSLGFAALNQNELARALEKRMPIDQLKQLADLWQAYQKDNMDQLINISKELEARFSFINDAIQAHLDRIPTKENQGRPTIALQEIIRELDTTEFVPVFKAFNQRESIYGFGDLQVKRLLDEIVSRS